MNVAGFHFQEAAGLLGHRGPHGGGRGVEPGGEARKPRDPCPIYHALRPMLDSSSGPAPVQFQTSLADRKADRSGPLARVPPKGMAIFARLPAPASQRRYNESTAANR